MDLHGNELKSVPLHRTDIELSYEDSDEKEEEEVFLSLSILNVFFAFLAEFVISHLKLIQPF